MPQRSEPPEDWERIRDKILGLGESSIHKSHFAELEQRLRELEASIAEQRRAETEKEALQARLIQAQKMEAIGQLAGGVAHDFNNLITVITLNGELLREALARETPAPRALEEILLAAQRAQALTHQLLAFSRKQELRPQLCDFNGIVADAEKLFRRLIGENIEVAIQMDPEPSLVHVDPGQLTQVLLNLAINARDAMPEGGRLWISTKRVTVEENESRVLYAEMKPGRYAVVQMEDSGCGMPPEVQAHIFEPFFTTKPLGKGTGLGLATVYGIVKQSGGHVSVYSELGTGTCFRIHLPLASATAEAPVRDSIPSMPHGTETLLVVEDDPTLRPLLQSALELWGYQVLEAPDPLAALQVAEVHDGPIHLLLTDMIMPHFSGRELSERLSPTRPEMKILIMSGYSESTINPGERRAFALLQKPFSMRELNRKVREILDAD